MTDPEWLANLRRLAQGATPGPWTNDAPSITAHVNGMRVHVVSGDGSKDLCRGCDDGDAAFIAACSPQTVQWLLEMLVRAEWGDCVRDDDARTRDWAARFDKGPP